jgi:quercetin dioxygenase-like cupin family protein
MKRLLIGMIAVVASGLAWLPASADAQQKFVVRPLVEKKVAELPAGPLFWRLENFATLDEARAAAGPWALAAEAAGKAWLFTLGPAGGASPGGTRVAEVGPIPRVTAPEFLLRINEGSGPPGSITPPHTHPGSEAFYVISGETSSHTPHGVKRVAAGQTETGHGPDTPMQVSSSGTTDLHSLVMFVVDATRPFSAPAKLP